MQGCTPWTEQAKFPVPVLAIPENGFAQNEMETPPRSPSSSVGGTSSSSPSSSMSAASAPEQRRLPSAARAAKRQRGRERRKFFRAETQRAAAEERAALAQAETASALPESEGFDAKFAAVAAEVKLVVKKTFFEVDVEDSDSSESSMLELPPALFNSTPEVDEWRRAYRRFRLGYHQGATGEFSVANMGLPNLDLRICQEPRSRWHVSMPACAA